MPSTPHGPEGIVYRLDEALVFDGGQPHPGIDIFVSLISTLLPNLGVVSMQPPSKTNRALMVNGLDRWIKDKRIKQSDESELELYEAIAADLGAPANKLVAVDTSVRGIAAAHRLGFYCIGLVTDVRQVRPGELIEAGAACVAANHLTVSEYVGDLLGTKSLKAIAAERKLDAEAKTGGPLC